MESNQLTTIGLDLGTSGVKGVCWNRKNGILRSATAPVPLVQSEEGRIEIDPAAYLELTTRMIRELAEAAATPVAGMAFAAASGNTLLCKQDATPLTPIISWLDTRLNDWMPPREWNVRNVCGWPAIPTFPLMHLEFFRREMPHTLASANIAMNNDWLCWRLCGKHALDTSNATPFYLWNQGEAHWERPILAYYGIREDQLPDMLPPGRIIAPLATEFQKGNLTGQTIIVTGSFDHPSAARAAGITETGELLLSCGTSWVGFYPASSRNDIPDNELCDVFQSADGGCWGGMFSLAQVGREVEDFICGRYGFGASRHEDFNQEAKRIGTPAREKMDSVITRFRALLERRPRQIRHLVVCGGPSEGEAWPEAIESLLGIPVEVSPFRSYTGAVGAAMLAEKAVQADYSRN